MASDGGVVEVMADAGDHPRVPARAGDPTTVTKNAVMRALLERTKQLGPTPYPVLVEGPTGSGKELVARNIHAASDRSGPFVPINCGAVPEHLFEAELFGARRGAYTGLGGDRKGLFHAAHGGTLLLDEIAEMPLSIQPKLLRVLQDGQVRPLGSSTSEPVDVRIIAATHKDVSRLVAIGDFRMDLYFRISAIRLRVPALAARPEDILPLLEEAVAEAARVQGIPVPRISEEALELALNYHWPGNVRELQQLAARAVFNAQGPELGPEDFGELYYSQKYRAVRSAPDAAADTLELPATAIPSFDAAQAAFEKKYFAELMRQADGNLSRAAKMAGLARTTLRDKVERLGLLPEGGLRRGRPRTRPLNDPDR